MNWLITSLHWYLYIFILGIIFLPTTTRIFKKFSFDLGYPFAKVFAILFISYTAYVLGTVKILSFARINLFLIIGFFIAINLFVYLKNRKLHVTRYKLHVLIFEELLFFASFLFWTYIRGQEPSIRSLEKFMDFGFINSILRTQYFPPLDIWYSGNHPINYYYFGHLTGATLIKLINIIPAIGYNLLLSTIFALGVTEVFSLVVNMIKIADQKISHLKVVIFGLIGSFIVNLGGNLHTIYLFTKGYPNENPIPFWKILSGFNPEKYWYPNATRFIPFTIHEFPSYSYVVADLHGHVFDIPFVLLTLAVLFNLFIPQTQISIRQLADKSQNYHLKLKAKKNISYSITQLLNYLKSISTNFNQSQLVSTIFLGFLTAVHYMTNAFDGPIYFLLSLIILFFIYRLSSKFLYSLLIIFFSFLIFSLPFAFHFRPFVSGIGVNCGAQIFPFFPDRIGPFLFEKGNCQISPLWMLFILWGFFWASFGLFLIIKNRQKNNETMKQVSNFVFILFSFGTLLVIIPEFFYIKDIYPAHFRANTMFKLGYQAFIMMGIACAYVLFFIKKLKKTLFIIIYSLLFILIFLYPFFSIPSYYGALNRSVNLDGSSWLKDSYPEDKEIIDWLNMNVKGQPVILEAQGDSYTDYERISAMTGLPTVAGWWVHEWLWRGSSDIVGKRIPDIVDLYESKDLKKTRQLIKKYQIKYIIISRLEREKYPNLNEEKFLTIGKLLLKSTNGIGALYQVD